MNDAVRSGGVDGTARGEMTQKAKFLNKHGELEEDLMQFLTDDANFKVVGVIGVLTQLNYTYKTFISTKHTIHI